MSVLFVGCYRDGTGWGHAATEAALALDKGGVDVVARCVKFSSHKVTIPTRLKALEEKSGAGEYRAVIQFSLPQTFEYEGRLGKNIGYFFTETDRFDDCDWVGHANMMDEVWVPSHHNRAAAITSGVAVPVQVVPCAVDAMRYAKSPKPVSIPGAGPDDFLFYSIFEGTRRKNMTALVTAFHLEFDPDEPVNLVIKTSLPGHAPEAAEEKLRVRLAAMKAELNLYPKPHHYKREIILTKYLSDEGVASLHGACDCFVLPTFGEGWCLPAFDAMAYGKTPIVTATGALLDFVSGETGWLVPGRQEPVHGMQDVHGDLYTARQTWCSADIGELRRAMREAYEDEEMRRRKAEAGIERAWDFDRGVVGKLMRGLLQ